MYSSQFTCHDRLAQLKKNPKEIALKLIFIDQSELTPKIYNIHTLLDILNNNHNNLTKIKHMIFGHKIVSLTQSIASGKYNNEQDQDQH